jgi:O-acetyl-ADP-ribose deacetylase
MPHILIAYDTTEGQTRKIAQRMGDAVAGAGHQVELNDIRKLPMNVTIVEGNLLDQDVDVIVNAWNRNIIPWWLLLPQGVSGAIKKRGGTGPFKELRKHGPIPLGGAVLTSAGRLPFKGIIHVAGINMLWRASERSIRDSVRNALALAAEKGFRSIAFPLIGAGSGGFNQERAQAIMLDELQKLESPLEVTVVVRRVRRVYRS